jgi:hypothetical protein
MYVSANSKFFAMDKNRKNILYKYKVGVAQWPKRLTTAKKIAGSNPTTEDLNLTLW